MPRLTRDPSRAARALVAGHLAVLPTETVYGLAADARNPDAVGACFLAKGRPPWHPVIVHIPAAAAIRDWAREIPGAAAKLVAELWPGPLTVVVPARDDVDRQLTGGQATVALRSPACEVFADVLGEMSRIQGFAAAVAAPSANRFGRVSPTTANQARRAVGRWLGVDDVILDGGPARIGVESTVVDCTQDRIRVLRPGAVGLGRIEEILGRDAVDRSGAPAEARAPGGLASHYAPRAAVKMADVSDLEEACSRISRGGSRNVGFIARAGVTTPVGLVRLAAPRSTADFAHGLYGWLHAADEAGIDVILVVPPSPADGDPLAGAVIDRLGRAAGSVRTRPPSPGA